MQKWVVDLIPWPQFHKGFKDSWKLCLNLCSLKWLRPRRSFLISSTPLGLWQLYTELAAGLINWRIFFLNARKLSELQRLGSNLFHSNLFNYTFCPVCDSVQYKRIFYWINNKKESVKPQLSKPIQTSHC